MSDTHPRIGLNAQLLSGSASYRRAGIHQYIDRLLHHLPAVGDDAEFIVYTNREAKNTLKGLRARATTLPTTRPLVRILWEQIAQPAWARVDGLEILHSLAFVSPLIRPCPTVVTVYDLSFLRFPELFRGANAAYLRLFTRLSCWAATRVIAISESTRDDMVRFYDLPPQRVDVALPGVDPAFRPLPREQVEAFRRKQGLPETFILHLGTLEPRKNHLKLLEAFARTSNSSATPSTPPRASLQSPISNLQSPISNLQSPISNLQSPLLVCVGGKGWFYDQIYAAVERLNLRERVIFAGFVPAEELQLWYNAATLFVYPSLYEGFGLPVLEAMACGLPVITSNVSSLPEAAGDAALLVSPNDVESLADAMQRLLASPDLRQQLSQAGQARAAGFTWKRTARETMYTYRKVLYEI